MDFKNMALSLGSCYTSSCPPSVLLLHKTDPFMTTERASLMSGSVPSTISGVTTMNMNPARYLTTRLWNSDIWNRFQDIKIVVGTVFSSPVAGHQPEPGEPDNW